MFLLELPILDHAIFPISGWQKNADSTHSPLWDIAANPNNFPNFPFWVIVLLWGGSEINRQYKVNNRWSSTADSEWWSSYGSHILSLPLLRCGCTSNTERTKNTSQLHEVALCSVWKYQVFNGLQEHTHTSPFLPCWWVGRGIDSRT